MRKVRPLTRIRERVQRPYEMMVEGFDIDQIDDALECVIDGACCMFAQSDCGAVIMAHDPTGEDLIRLHYHHGFDLALSPWPWYEWVPLRGDVGRRVIARFRAEVRPWSLWSRHFISDFQINTPYARRFCRAESRQPDRLTIAWAETRFDNTMIHDLTDQIVGLFGKNLYEVGMPRD
ncbi:MAG: hypothetical protein SF069_03240 [Phycisphaerae bacterium]|nr:hypothetical protein [Phycisphaerae bacterium]